MSGRAWVAFAAVSVLWGMPYLFIKIAIEDLSPGFVAWSRVALAAAVLLPLAASHGVLRGLREHWRAVALYSLVEITVPFFLIAAGEQWVSSSVTAILIAAMPLMVAGAAARLTPEDRPRGPRLAGLGLGLLGVVLLVGIDVAGETDELLGALCILGATACYATATLVIGRGLAGLSPLGTVGAALGIAAVLLAPVGLAGAPGDAPPADAAASIVVLGLICTAVALLAFFALVREAGPSRASVITYVNPAVAVTLGVAVLGESLGAASLGGMLLILAGSWLATT